jgi:glycosyltransferase involved in cell wall biosynthesis
MSIPASGWRPVVAFDPNGEGEGNERASISVVIPTHNRPAMLRQAIESVLASPLIASPDQIIVIDDDPGNGDTADLVRTFGATYQQVCHRNAARSRNAGWRQARTPYIAFLDDDDLWLPGNMESQLEALRSNPKAAIAYAMAKAVTESLDALYGNYPSPPLPSGHVPNKLHLSYPQIGTVLFRRDALSGANGFDERIRYYEDADLMIRIASRHEIVGVEMLGILYRERVPSRARADYFWSDPRREVIRWRPQHVGVQWTTAVRFRFRTSGLFCWRFIADAAACVALGNRRDALVCLGRALRVSPVHVARHLRMFGSLAWQCHRRPSRPRTLVATR